MTLTVILILTAAAIPYATLLPARARGTALLSASIICLYLLQPPLPIRFSDFLLPTLSLLLAVAGWYWTRDLRLTIVDCRLGENEDDGTRIDTDEFTERSHELTRINTNFSLVTWRPLRLCVRFFRRLTDEHGLETSSVQSPVTSHQSLNLSVSQSPLSSDDRFTLILSFGLVLALSLFRYIPAEYRLTPSRPPSPLAVGIVMGVLIMGVFILARLRPTHHAPRTYTLPITLILLLFITLKTEPLAAALSTFFRSLTNQDTSLAAAADLNWLGFSYLAFRLLHTLRDRQSGLLPNLSLREYLTYILFFPALTAGPIDRAERFTPEYRALPQLHGPDASRWFNGLLRIGTGLGKKFIIADALAQGVALNPINATQVQSTFWLWILLYGYAFRLYFDFSGYSDIAIGLGQLFGFHLPENFNYPYLKSNLTTFWQSWHITLSDWARFYVFSPLSRWLLKRPSKPSSTVIVLMTQLATMITIGLWHGVSGNFLMWGAWHGIGLFVHQQWRGRTRTWQRHLNDKPGQKRFWTFLAWFLTFHYVVLGWVWFLLPDIRLAGQTFLRLFGLGW